MIDPQLYWKQIVTLRFTYYFPTKYNEQKLQPYCMLSFTWVTPEIVWSSYSLAVNQIVVH